MHLASILLLVLLVVPPASAAEPALLAQLSARALDRGSVRVIVRLEIGFRAEGELEGVQVHSQRRGIHQTGESLLSALGDDGVFAVTRFETIPYLGLSVNAAALDRLTDRPEVVSVHEDRLVPPALGITVPLIGADDAAAMGFTGAGQVVAVLDSGVDKSHPFFAGGKVVSEACFSKNDPASASQSLCPNGAESQIGPGAGVPCEELRCDHGTHVAGIAAGSTSGLRGVAPGADLISIQVFSLVSDAEACEGPATCILAFDSDLIQALERVRTLSSSMSVASVNMSLGGGEYPGNCDNDPMKAIVDNLRSRGIATVVASGNESFTAAIGFPACISTAIAVGASSRADYVLDFSNSSPTLDLLAPGLLVESSVPNGRWDEKSGTSMATPHVAGAWAVLKDKVPQASVDAVELALESTGVPIRDDRNGLIRPRIQVDAALDALSDTIAAPSQLSATLGGLSVDLSWRDNSTNEEGFRVYRALDDEALELLIELAPNTTETSDETLAAGHVYRYQVTAFGPGGESPPSNQVTVEPTCSPPLAPSGLLAAPISATGLHLSWQDQSVDETGFQVEIAAGSGGDYSLATTTEANVIFAELGSLLPDHEYRVRVAAVGEAACLSSYSEDRAWTPVDDPSHPAAPDELLAIVGEGSVYVTWRDNSHNELGFQVERRLVHEGSEFMPVASIPLDNSTSTPGTEVASHLPGSEYEYRVHARGVGGDSEHSEVATARIPEPGGSCTPDPSTPCLLGGRFRVEVQWRNQFAGYVTGVPVNRGDLGDRTASLAFFNPDVVDLIVKVLDGRPITGDYWVYFGALSDVEYWVTVTDTQTAAIVRYHNPPGEFCGNRDIHALPGAIESLSMPRPLRAALAQEGSCVADAETLCLRDARFQIRVSWQDQAGAAGSGVGVAVPDTDDSGFFWFFSADNTELAIKVLDGTAINGHHWVYYGALSDVYYEIEITDTSDGSVRTFTNPQGSFCGQRDIEAF